MPPGEAGIRIPKPIRSGGMGSSSFGGIRPDECLLAHPRLQGGPTGADRRAFGRVIRRSLGMTLETPQSPYQADPIEDMGVILFWGNGTGRWRLHTARNPKGGRKGPISLQRSFSPFPSGARGPTAERPAPGRAGGTSMPPGDPRQDGRIALPEPILGRSISDIPFGRMRDLVCLPHHPPESQRGRSRPNP
jgi:hypothetical protein